MSPLLADFIAVLLATLAAWVLPAVVMSGLAPALAEGRVVPNYRGRSVYPGLGLAWMVWVVGLLAVRVVVEAAGAVFPALQDAAFHLFSGALGVAFTGMPLLLVVVAFAFGLADDVFGTSGHKGFRGHLRALRTGRVTTGALKLFGIGIVAMFYGWTASARVVPLAVDGTVDILPRILAWILATLVIGLASNVFNLLDLRPGRALKMYVVAAVPLAIAFAHAVMSGYSEFAASVGDSVGAAATVSTTESVAMALTSLIVLIGPAMAIWRFDLGERGMLGDAGSNVLGVITGFLLVGVLPLWGFAVAAAVLLALNLAAEKISFSRVIEGVGLLRWLDSLGRETVEEEGSPAERVGDPSSPEEE